MNLTVSVSATNGHGAGFYGSDNDCNGQADETLTVSTYCTEAEGDGHGVAGQATMTGCAPKKGFALCDNDCSDADFAVFVGTLHRAEHPPERPIDTGADLRPWAFDDSSPVLRLELAGRPWLRVASRAPTPCRPRGAVRPF